VTLFSFLIALLLACGGLNGENHPFDAVPVAARGRFVPAEAYAQQWLYSRAQQRRLHRLSAVDLLLALQLHGYFPFAHDPLFAIHHADLKQFLGLNPRVGRYSFHLLKERVGQMEGIERLDSSAQEEFQELKGWLLEFEGLRGSRSSAQKAMAALLEKLQAEKRTNKEIALEMERQFPIERALREEKSLLRPLPSKRFPGIWYSLGALDVVIYNPQSNSLLPAGNFTIYSDELFAQLRSSYRRLQQLAQSAQAESEAEVKRLARLLNEGYQTIASTGYIGAAGKQLSYPSQWQLQAELFYVHYPLALWAAIGYAATLLLLLLAGCGPQPAADENGELQAVKGHLTSRWLARHSSFFTHIASGLFLATFFLHTLLLLLRCYILGRPPVANMFETLLYVPWVAVVGALILRCSAIAAWLQGGAALTAAVLLLLLHTAQAGSSFDNVQAVLDSQYWLAVHVLMVVASYGMFLLAGVLAHGYLFSCLYSNGRTARAAHSGMLGSAVLRALYIGVSLLIPGTILGGVWAAESWGRFWDWDPKESWAFISICTYLLVIHAYRFNYIGYFGIAVGAIAGLMVISFTWYGVNYILGSGLHSYGFGSGGEACYYSYLLAEIAFLAMVFAIQRSQQRNLLL
jgi:ABC-type transport system involved in cytochrome c biogenesis permease subunit